VTILILCGFWIIFQDLPLGDRTEADILPARLQCVSASYESISMKFHRPMISDPNTNHSDCTDG